MKISHKSGYSREFPGTVEEIFAALPVASQDYLKAYGLRQALADSMAQSKDNAADAEARLHKRWEKLLAGTMSVRETGPRNPAETEALRIAAQRVDDALKAKNLKRPDNYKALVAATRVKYAAEIAVEVEARLARAKTIEINLDDLFAPDADAETDEDAEHEAAIQADEEARLA